MEPSGRLVLWVRVEDDGAKPMRRGDRRRKNRHRRCLPMEVSWRRSRWPKIDVGKVRTLNFAAEI